MSGETEQSVSGWTTDTLRVHLEALAAELSEQVELARSSLRELMDERDRRYTEVPLREIESAKRAMSDLMDERDRRYNARFDAQEKAVAQAQGTTQTAIDKAEDAQAQRNAIMNQFREQLRHQADEFATKDLVDRIAVTHEERLRLATDALSKRLESAITGIADLNNSYTAFVAEYGGRTQEKSSVKDDSRAMVWTVVAIVSVLIAIAGLAAGIISNAS